MFPLPLVPTLVVLVASAAGAYGLWKLRAHRGIAHGTLTPERQVIYETAIEYLRDAKSLRTIADEFERQGLPTIALRLRRRADVQELPDEKKAIRREIYRKARASTNVTAILEVAKQFDESGSPGAAYNLRRYAEGIQAALKAGQAPQAPPNLPAESRTFPQSDDFAGDPNGHAPSSFGGRKRKRRGSRGGRPMPPQPPGGQDDADPSDGADDATAAAVAAVVPGGAAS